MTQVRDSLKVVLPPDRTLHRVTVIAVRESDPRASWLAALAPGVVVPDCRTEGIEFAGIFGFGEEPDTGGDSQPEEILPRGLCLAYSLEGDEELTVAIADAFLAVPGAKIGYC